MKPDISVIIASYNQAKIISKSVKELVSQADEANLSLQIIIADDGSNIYNVQKLYEAIVDVEREVDIALIWQSDLDFRLAESRNNAIAIATSDIMVFVDGDCVPESDLLISYMRAHKESRLPTLFIGHRSFQLPSDADNLELKEKLYRREREEIFDIKKRVASDNPWSAVSGRNFCLLMPDKKIYFDWRMRGWSPEDTFFGLEYAMLGGTEFAYLEEASVAQYDDLSSTTNPYVTNNQKHISYAITNILIKMREYESNDNIYRHLALILNYYTIPFEYNSGKYCHDADIAYNFFRRAVQGLSYSREEAENFYTKAYKNLDEFFSNNKDFRTHKYFDLLKCNKVNHCEKQVNNARIYKLDEFPKFIANMVHANNEEDKLVIYSSIAKEFDFNEL